MIYLDFFAYSLKPTQIYPNVEAFAEWFTGVTVLWGCYKTVKHEISTFIILGHFLLLYSPHAEEASRRCNYHLTSPVLPESSRYCILQVALYEAGPAVGNLTLLIKPVLSGSAVHSVVLNHRRRDGHRSANTHKKNLFICVLFIQHNMSI